MCELYIKIIKLFFWSILNSRPAMVPTLCQRAWPDEHNNKNATKPPLIPYWYLHTYEKNIFIAMLRSVNNYHHLPYLLLMFRQLPRMPTEMRIMPTEMRIWNSLTFPCFPQRFQPKFPDPSTTWRITMAQNGRGCMQCSDSRSVSKQIHLTAGRVVAQYCIPFPYHWKKYTPRKKYVLITSRREFFFSIFLLPASWPITTDMLLYVYR